MPSDKSVGFKLLEAVLKLLEAKKIFSPPIVKLLILATSIK